ncbi:ABC transporter ATP-binding protein [Nocardia puris]|nr:ABC transporter ATP-binding protein [Nocardia puris]MBF6366311.1 ABC transporter ATP-binding protein [Nocardia puris]MBF6458350.1 ABC transporter ATP-binding protein [Nocardia puris]
MRRGSSVPEDSLTGDRPETVADPKQAKQAEKAARAAILAPVRGRLAIASAIVFASAVCAVLPFVLIVEAARRLLDGDTTAVWQPVLVALILLGLRGMLYSGALLWTHVIDADNQLHLRQSLADKLRRVPLGWFGARTSGEVKKLLQDDVEAIHYLVAHAQMEFTAAIVTPLLTLGYLFLVDWRLALALLAPLALYGVALGAMMGRNYDEKMREYTEWEKRSESATVEFVDGIQVVRAFGQARRAHTRYREAVEGFTDYFKAWATPMTRIEASASLLLNPVFLMVVVLAVGLPLVSGGMSALDLLPFLLLGLGLGTTVLTVGYSAQSLRQADAACLRLHEQMQVAELEEIDPVDAQVVEPGTVVFEDVQFGYHEGHDVLKGVSATLRPGTITALVGPSGSGKSTMAKLLPRFHDVTRGRITIDGQDIRSMPQEDLYRLVSFVFQDVRLLHDTVRANLALARPDASAEEIERVARAAQIHDRILELPRGYDSVIGDDARLSGGEAQRLSIARALLADAPILVLDEATAFADPESEAAIQDALAELVARRTVLVIAHRLHTITGVDELLVLEDGKLVERGTHDELLAAGGTYRGLWDANEAAVRDLGEIEGAAR